MASPEKAEEFEERYEWIPDGELGSGMMAKVAKARVRQSGQLVAVKMVEQKWDKSPECNFREEVCPH